MNGRNKPRSRFTSEQKPLRRRNQRVKDRTRRESVDLAEVHRRVVEAGTQRKTFRFTWIKVVTFIIAIPGFFLVGYWIAALSVPTSMKALIALPVAVLGIVLSYVVSSLFR